MKSDKVIRYRVREQLPRESIYVWERAAHHFEVSTVDERPSYSFSADSRERALAGFREWAEEEHPGATLHHAKELDTVNG